MSRSRDRYSLTLTREDAEFIVSEMAADRDGFWQDLVAGLRVWLATLAAVCVICGRDIWMDRMGRWETPLGEACLEEPRPDGPPYRGHHPGDLA